MNKKFLSDENIPPFILLEFYPTKLERAIKNEILSDTEIVKIIYS